MGQFLSQPKTDKDSFDENDKATDIRYGVTSMQGWRSGMEDAHLCNLDYDNGRKLFGVFDGHAGPEVAKFLALHLGEFLLANKLYISCKDKKVNVKKIGKALTETFMTIDAHLLTDEAIEELEKLSDRHPERESCDNSDDEAEEARELVSEASMSLHELMAKYGEVLKEDDEVDDKDGTSKHTQARKHLQQLAEKAGFAIDFGNGDGEEENGDENGQPDADSSDAAVKLEAESSESSSSRRSRKAKPTKGKAGPVSVKPEPEDDSESLSSCEKPATSSKRKASGSEESEAKVKVETEKKATMNGVNEEEEKSSIDGQGDEDDEDDSGDDYKVANGDGDSDEDDEDDDDEDDEEEEEEEEEEEDEDDIDEDMNAGMDEFDQNFPQGVGKSSGSTAVAALLIGDQLIVANTGDSRCVLCRGGTAVAMSEDHQPELDEERARVEAAGGVVSEAGRVNNGLNMSRAIGDHGYKMRDDLPADEQMIIATPDIRTETIGESDEFMILACDGIWNCMTNEECVKFVRKRLLKRGASTCLSAICEEVCDHCLAPDITGDGTGSDNMTIMVVLLKKDLAPTPVRRKKGRHSTGSAAEDGGEEASQAGSPARKKTKRAR